MDFNIPGLERGALVAAFSGAIAYLCTQDKMPAVRAGAFVIAGGVAAAYIGPGIVEWLALPSTQHGMGMVLGEKAKYALIFVTGVGGIWIINIIVSVLQEIQKRVGGAISRWLGKVFGEDVKEDIKTGSGQ